MSSFDEAMRRREAQQTELQARQAEASNDATLLAQRALPTVRAAFRDLAQYLSKQGVPTYAYRHYQQSARSHLLSRYLAPSPAGYFVYGNGSRELQKHHSREARKGARNFDQLILLLPDGRLWEHSQGNRGAKQGIVEISAEALAARDVFIRGLGRIEVDAAGAVVIRAEYSDGRCVPLADALAELGMKMKSTRHPGTPT